MSFPVTIKFLKTHDLAILPKFNHNDPYTGDTGLDVYAVDHGFVSPGESVVVPVGLKLAYLTPGYWLSVASRSGLAFKHNILAYTGTIDNAYAGDLGIKIFNFSRVHYSWKIGDRIAQLIVHPLIQADAQWATEINETKRGEKGFGSSGV